MAATPEVKAKDRIKKAMAKSIVERGLYAKIRWNAGQALGVSRLDCDGVVAGHPFEFEVKRFDGKGKTTARQLSDVRDACRAGAFSMIVEDEESLAVLLHWLRTIEPRSEWGDE